MDPPLGTIVTIPQGKGVVRFAGPTSFAIGKWVGIELYDQNGKNDGTVNGVAYFACKMGYGVFVRQSQIKSTHGNERDEVSGAVRPALPRHQRTSSSSGLLRANSLRSTPSATTSRSASPSKPTAASKVLLAKPPASRRTSLTIRQPPQVPSSPQQSASPSPRGQPSPLNISPPHAAPKRTSSPLTLPPIQASSSPRPQSPLSLSPVASTSFRAPEPPPAPAPSTTISPPDPALLSKIRSLEAKRAQDAQTITQLESQLSSSSSLVSLLPKLQAKLSSQQAELLSLRRDLADAQQLAQLAEGRVVDAQEQLEMAMLDREVAEERAELAEVECAEMREEVEVLRVEVGVLKGGAKASDGDDDDEEVKGVKSSLAYIQLEKHNERLKEALIKLRDMTQETEQEQRRRIAEMESDVAGFEELQAQYSEALTKLSNAENQMDDLKLQLDDALGAEEMLVQLTERNLMLGEKIEEMRITIEDLEALKELNDELEENHAETEKQLHEDLEAKDAQIREQDKKIQHLEELCTDLEGTIGQFRDLVVQLQGDLDALRAQTASAQTESATAVSQSAAMLSMNLKLQSTFSKNQSRLVELESLRLAVHEGNELLGIVQPYLPQAYVDNGDGDAAGCYLFFRRVGGKVDLVNLVVGMAHGMPDALNGEVSEDLVGVCEMRGRISALSTLCKRFASILRRCDVETFLNIGRIFPEIAPLEKRIDMHIDLLRKDEFRVMECVSDIVKIQAQFEHLAETYFGGFEHDVGERELGYLISFDHDLDMLAAAIGLAKTSVTTVMKDEDAVLDMGGYEIEPELLDPLQALLDQCKGAKSLSKKLTKRLDELTQDSNAIKPHLIPQMKGLSDSVAELVNFGISLAQQTTVHVRDARSSRAPFQLVTVLGIVKQTATSTVAPGLKPGSSPWEAVSASIAQLVEEGSKLLPLVMEAENVLKITGIAPWVTRISEIKAAMAVNVEAERKVAQLSDEMQAMARSLKTKDQNIQESAVRIELMERRMESAKKQHDMITELENELAKAKKQERAYEEAMEQLQTDLDSLEQDNVKLKALTAGQERQATGPQPVDVPAEGNLETSYLLEQIEALRGTVRYLRTENSYLKGQDLLREIESLPPLVESAPRTTTPALDPSGLSDTDEDDSESESPRSPPTLRSLATETKMLYRDVIKYSSAPRVVDLSALNAKRAEGGKGGKIWMPRKKTPAYQVLERKMEGEELNRRVQGLLARASAIGNKL